MQTINFNNLKRKYLTVTLPDEETTVLQISMPTKKIVDELLSVQSRFTNIEESNSTDLLTDIYTLSAKIMSKNKTNKKVSKEFLEEHLSIEDITLFFKSYMDFVQSTVNQKN